MSHSTSTSAMGDLEINSLVRSTDWCGICGMDLCDSACNPNLNQYNSIMENDLLNEIDRIVWSDGDAEMILASIQSLMYQWGACQDAKTEQMFGDDDAHISKRKY